MRPSSGFGIHVGQYTGALMRSARRCQRATAFAGQRILAEALTTPFAPQPASANAAATRTPTRFIVPLKPVNRDPGPCAAAAGPDVVDKPRPRPQRVVERRLARIVRAGCQHAVGDRPRDDHIANALAPEACDVPFGIEPTFRTRKIQV